MTAETPFLRAILPSLPNDFAKKVRSLCGSTSSESSSAEHVLDTLIRFVSGAECASYASAEAREQWAEKQQAVAQILNGMINRPTTDEKRQREEDSEPSAKASKRQRTSAEGSPAAPIHDQLDQPVFTIHSVSATSPVRKKVDITIHQTVLALSHPVARTIEATIPLTNLVRAFLLPTRGKQKPHWTVVLLTSDSPDRSNSSTISSSLQLIFGVDAVATAPFSFTVHSTTTHNTESSTPPAVAPKGSHTRPFLLDFLNRLGVPVFEPTPDIFKSACVGITSGVSANEDGIPGVEAYRGAKVGSLWFMKEGILWGESKPCEFWALEDLIDKNEGVRVVGGTGRTCSVVLTRKSSEEMGEGEEDMGVESEFGMVDSKEKASIDMWVRMFRNLFGKKKIVNEGNATVGRIEDDSDEEDEDFEMDSDEEHDGSTSSSGTSSDGEEKGDDPDDHEDGVEEDAEESDKDAEGSEDELTEEHHPLLRPGAMPRRVNRAVIDMVVGLVEDDMLGTNDTPTLPSEQSDDDEEDELDD